MASEKPKDPSDGISVRLVLGDAHIGVREPGVSEDEQFLEEIRRLGIDTSDLDRPLDDLVDQLGVIQCVAVAEAVWHTELGPRSGTVSEIGDLAYSWPSLRALMDAAKTAPKR